jgi:hypothetical protein
VVPAAECGDRVDNGVKIESGNVRILHFDVTRGDGVVSGNMYVARSTVVHERKRDLVLGSNWVADDNLVDVVKFIPVILLVVHVSIERLKLWSSRNSHVQRFGSVKALLVEKIVVVFVSKVTEELIS